MFVEPSLSSDPADPTAAVTRIAAKLRDFMALDVATMFAAIDIASNLAAQTAVTRILGSGQVRYITRPKSRTMRVTRQLMLPPSTVT